MSTVDWTQVVATLETRIAELQTALAVVRGIQGEPNSVAPQPLAACRVVQPPRQQAKTQVRAAREERPDGAVATVLAALQKRPMTSAELIAQTDLTSGSVYAVLARLRKDGRIVTEAVDGSIARVNKLVEG